MSLRIVLFCVLGGFCFTFAAVSTGHFWLWWLSGTLTVGSLVPVVRFGSRRPAVEFAAIALALIVVGLVCTLSEGILFFPAMKEVLVRNLAGGVVEYVVIAAILTAMARGMKLSEPTAQTVEHRGMGWAVPMILLSGVSYVVYYLIFGSIAFQFFTKQYYPHAQEQVMAIGMWFWGYQFGRGLLMTLAVLPIIYSLRLPRWQAALVVGAVVWIVGGAAGLLVPNEVMVARQRYIHIVEIMTQNVSLGATAVLLLRPKRAAVTAQMHSATSA